MSYVSPDFKTKKELKQAVESGKELRTYNPSGMFPTIQNGNDVISGPHYPTPHKWYAAVTVLNGLVIKVNK